MDVKSKLDSVYVDLQAHSSFSSMQTLKLYANNLEMGDEEVPDWL